MKQNTKLNYFNILMLLEEFYLDFLKEHKKQYALYLLTLLYVPLSRVGIPHFYGKLIGHINNKKIQWAFNILIILIIVWFVTQVIHTSSNIMHAKFMPKFVEFFRLRMIDNIFTRYSTNFEDLHIGDTISKIIKSPWILEDVFETAETMVFNNALVILSSFIYLFFYHKSLGVIYIICMASVGLISTLFIKECTDTVTVSEQIFDRTHEEIEDTLSNLISVYTSNKDAHEQGRIKILSKYIYDTQRTKLKCFGKYRKIFTVVFVIIFIILNVHSFTLYINKKIKLSTLSAIIIINYSLLTSFMSVYTHTKHIIDLKGRISLFMMYLDKLPKKNNIGNEKIPNIENGIKIDLKNIKFSYLPNKYILNNINITIKPREHVAFVGKIGSGKSTTAKLLVRLFDFDSGAIMLNGVEIKKLAIDNLRASIRYIPQHPKLFNRTLYENIIYSTKHEVKKEEILDILKSLDLKDIYDKFKDKMDTSVGKNGSKLSGGQRQVVWLLRALIEKPPVIILDEPTASMDVNSKIEVTKLVKKLGEKSTIILITHDEMLLKYVDRKIEFGGGNIITTK
jgi:ABC-type multidrug transport system fused ATPase/permease subunit